MTYTIPITNCKTTQFNQSCLIEMPTSFTLSEAERFESQFQNLAQVGSTVSKVILDFGQTNFMDSSGLICLYRVFKAAPKSGITILIWSLSAEIEMILSLIGLDKLFPIVSNTEAITEVKANSNFQSNTVSHPSVQSRIKRLIDVVGGMVGLAITAMIFIPLAIAIKLDSPGPVLFSQTRCGYRGGKFKIWKFRSMVVNASQLQHQVKNQSSGPFFKNEDDPRITKVGRFLRKTSLDEFPQFWNVLKGEMSLVGTRPPTVTEVEDYEVFHGQRFDVKPGITGEWQVNGRSKVKNFTDVLELDVRYQKNWSLLYDLKLICKTVLIMFSKSSGAC